MNSQEEKENKKHSPLRHMVHMVLCCGLPILIIMMLPFVAGFSPAVATVLGFIAPFICPLMMGGMVFMMFKSQKKSNCCDKENIIE